MARLAGLVLLAALAAVLLAGLAHARLTAHGAAHAVQVSPTANTAFISAPQVVEGMTITVSVTPAVVGANTFTVTLRDARGQPVEHAGVSLELQSLDMNMGVQTAQLRPAGSGGTYRGQMDVAMGGNFAITVQVLPPHATQRVAVRIPFTVAYW